MMNHNQIIEQKNMLRKQYETLRAGISLEERLKAEARILEHVQASEVILTSDHICSFVSFGTEVSTKGIHAFILQSGKTLYLPRISGSRTMDMIRVDAQTQFEINSYGIQEPIGEIMDTSSVQSAVCIIPLLSYDSFGHRLGYGGGYYDQFLSDKLSIKKIGLCFSIQCSQSEIPSEHHDIILDMIINEQGIFFPQKK
ncbi:MAG: 5-formyltetrahydrofolate cyclo-ligase [Ignavibacteria bacterium]